MKCGHRLTWSRVGVAELVPTKLKVTIDHPLPMLMHPEKTNTSVNSQEITRANKAACRNWSVLFDICGRAGYPGFIMTATNCDVSIADLEYVWPVCKDYVNDEWCDGWLMKLRILDSLVHDGTWFNSKIDRFYHKLCEWIWLVIFLTCLIMSCTLCMTGMKRSIFAGDGWPTIFLTHQAMIQWKFTKDATQDCINHSMMHHCISSSSIIHTDAWIIQHQWINQQHCTLRLIDYLKMTQHNSCCHNNSKYSYKVLSNRSHHHDDDTFVYKADQWGQQSSITETHQSIDHRIHQWVNISDLLLPINWSVNKS